MHYLAIIIEHGDGLNKHQWFISQVSNPMNYSPGNEYHELIDSGIRTTVDDCENAINDSVREYTIRKNPDIRITTFHS